MRDVTAPVPLVYLPVSLTRPGPSGSAGPSQLCRGCSHPPSATPEERLPPASPHRYDGEATKVSHLHPDKQRLVAHCSMATVHDSRGGSSNTMLMYGRSRAKETTESAKTGPSYCPLVPGAATSTEPPTKTHPARSSRPTTRREAAPECSCRVSAGVTPRSIAARRLIWSSGPGARSRSWPSRVHNS